MLCCLALICFGCKSSVPDKDEKTDGKDSIGETENGVDVSENLMTVYSSITADMLDSCNTVVSDLDSYYDSYYYDSLVLLNWFNDDTRLYGINAGEESAMLLYVQGEKVLIPYSGEVDFSNNIRFDVEKMQMKVVSGILMENSMPYYPSVFLNFDMNYRDGTFEIEKCEIERNAE